jgi:hypothetical protein
VAPTGGARSLGRHASLASRSRTDPRPFGPTARTRGSRLTCLGRPNDLEGAPRPVYNSFRRQLNMRV